MIVFDPGESVYSTVDDQIREEVQKYVHLCELAAVHTPEEGELLRSAHIIFYHIQELRSTRKSTPLPGLAVNARFLKSSSFSTEEGV